MSDRFVSAFNSLEDIFLAFALTTAGKTPLEKPFSCTFLALLGLDLIIRTQEKCYKLTSCTKVQTMSTSTKGTVAEVESVQIDGTVSACLVYEACTL